MTTRKVRIFPPSNALLPLSLPSPPPSPCPASQPSKLGEYMLKGWTMLNRNCECGSVWVGKGSVQKCPDCGASDEVVKDDNVDEYDALLDSIPQSLSREPRTATDPYAPPTTFGANPEESETEDEEEAPPRPFFSDVDVKTGEMLMAGWTLTGEGCKSGGGIGVVMRKEGKRWCSCCDGAPVKVELPPRLRNHPDVLARPPVPVTYPPTLPGSYTPAAAPAAPSNATSNDVYQTILSRIEEATQNLAMCDLSDAKSTFHWAETIERLSKAGKAYLEMK